MSPRVGSPEWQLACRTAERDALQEVCDRYREVLAPLVNAAVARELPTDKHTRQGQDALLGATFSWNERSKAAQLGELWSIAYYPNGAVHLKFRNGIVSMAPGDLYKLV